MGLPCVRASVAAWRGRLDEMTTKRPRDTNSLAKQIVDEATEQDRATDEGMPEKDPAAVARSPKPAPPPQDRRPLTRCAPHFERSSQGVEAVGHPL